ncbi:MAG: 2-amino-4-hydroxy-6-hydroxymethyldihydropteridine diphosphokinase [Rubrivivax sp.]|nr:2-amino-4-hydroxy-6-hydroxymethyldihydropteridine diphosphokinase [Rubrivivax sp.]
MKAERVFVGLGANLGDAGATLRQVLARLDALTGTRLIAASPLYRSAPLDAAGPDFINAVAELSTSVEPMPLLQALQAMELEHGRERPYHHAPRTLDLDLLLYGQRVMHSAALQLPHPRLHQRAFVLLPLLALAPDLQHPGLGPLQDWLAGVHEQTIEQVP